MLYGFAKIILRFIMIFIFRIKIEGRENMPEDCGVILASNHKSNWDPVLLALASPRKLRFMAKAELFKNKLFARLITTLGAFPVHRGKGDIGAIKSAIKILRDDGVMLIFPEGKRNKDETSTDVKPGAVMLAVMAKTPVLPVYISGKYHWFSKMTITFGKPIYYEEHYEKKPVVSELSKMSVELMKTVRSYKTEKKR